MRVWGPYSQDFGYDLINIYDSKSGAKANAIIVFVVVCAPCALAGDPTLEVRTASGIAKS